MAIGGPRVQASTFIPQCGITSGARGRDVAADASSAVTQFRGRGLPGLAIASDR